MFSKLAPHTTFFLNILQSDNIYIVQCMFFIIYLFLRCIRLSNSINVSLGGEKHSLTTAISLTPCQPNFNYNAPITKRTIPFQSANPPHVSTPPIIQETTKTEIKQNHHLLSQILQSLAKQPSISIGPSYPSMHKAGNTERYTISAI